MAAVNAVFAGWAMIVFIVFMRLDVLAWAIMDISSLVQMIAVFGLAFKKRELLHISIPLMLYFGGSGLFEFSWSKMPIALINNVLIIFTALFILYVGYKQHRYPVREMATWVTIGIFLVVLYEFIIFPWFAVNRLDQMQMLLDMGYSG